MEITTMNMSLKTAINFKEEVIQEEECLQMAVVTMVMMIDLKVMVIKIKTTYSRMKEGQWWVIGKKDQGITTAIDNTETIATVVTPEIDIKGEESLLSTKMTGEKEDRIEIEDIEEVTITILDQIL